jgi:hypothetical protein
MGAPEEAHDRVAIDVIRHPHDEAVARPVEGIGEHIECGALLAGPNRVAPDRERRQHEPVLAGGEPDGGDDLVEVQHLGRRRRQRSVALQDHALARCEGRPRRDERHDRSPPASSIARDSSR